MSIQDDYWDVQHALKSQSKDIKKSFEFFAEWAFDLEKEVDRISSELKDAKTTIKTMMKIK